MSKNVLQYFYVEILDKILSHIFLYVYFMHEIY